MSIHPLSRDFHSHLSEINANIENPLNVEEVKTNKIGWDNDTYSNYHYLLA